MNPPKTAAQAERFLKSLRREYARLSGPPDSDAGLHRALYAEWRQGVNSRALSRKYGIPYDRTLEILKMMYRREVY